MNAVSIDLQARVALAHAAVQALAEGHGVHLLHVKGPALDGSLRTPDRQSSDADVLVHPDQVGTLVAALTTHGWSLVTGFESGSVFEHAANYRHDDWGYLDLHRAFPGITVPAGEAFARLWGDRAATAIAHYPCQVPSVPDQALLLCLHAARGGGDARAERDLDRAWRRADPERRQAIRDQADRLGAQVALAAALGELDQHADDRTADLWRVYSQGGSRMEEWMARFRAAPTRRAALRTAIRGIGVNREFAAMELGHQPNRRELTGIFLGRFRTGFRQLGGRLADQTRQARRARRARGRDT